MKFANPLKRVKTINSIRGHVIDFPGKLITPDNPTGLTFVHVPLAIQVEAIAAGLMAESDLDEPEETVVIKAPADPQARQEAIFKAFSTLVERGEREDFAGNGAPKVMPVSKELGWAIDSKELKTLWPQYQAASAAGDDGAT